VENPKAGSGPMYFAMLGINNGGNATQAVFLDIINLAGVD